MKFFSTRDKNKSNPTTISSAIEQGLASDGGLFIPENVPTVTIPYKNIEDVLFPFFEEDLEHSELKSICEKAFNFPLPLTKLDEETHLLELYHGATASFKDLGAQFLANFFESQLAVSGGKTILVATSGDTGGAVAAAFWKKKNIAVKILFPEDGVSDLQKQQLTCWGKNIESFAVKGSFDDCQAMVKEAFGDRELQDKYHLSSANSINIGRLLPQMTFYFTASAEYLKVIGKVPNFIIPTGNLGNAQACFYARKMGAPIGEVIMATNANNTIPQYFSTGVWEPGEAISTLANAMDVAKPSNYERLFALHNDLDSLAAGAKSISVSDEKIKKSIKAVWDKYGMIICPHTATGFVAKEELDIDHAIIVATAHGAKFSSIIKPILGQEIALPESLSKLLKMESSYQSIGTDYRELFSD